MSTTELAELIDSKFRELREGSIVTGTIQEIRPQVVLVDIGYKSEGAISISEFEDEEIEVGDQIEVLLERLENDEGIVVLSKEKAAHKQNWDKIVEYAKKVWPTIKEYGVSALEGLKYVFMNFTPVGWLIQAFQAGADILNTSNWSDSGAKIIDTLIAGIKSKANALVEEVKGVFATVREYLPFSDAKRGPFSQLTKSGGAIARCS